MRMKIMTEKNSFSMNEKKILEIILQGVNQISFIYSF